MERNKVLEKSIAPLIEINDDLRNGEYIRRDEYNITALQCSICFEGNNKKVTPPVSLTVKLQPYAVYQHMLKSKFSVDILFVLAVTIDCRDQSTIALIKGLDSINVQLAEENISLIKLSNFINRSPN